MGGRVGGVVVVGGSPILCIGAGVLLDADKQVLLVLWSDSKVDEMVKLFSRTGYTKFAGYLAGGMKSWNNAGLPIETVPQMSVHDVKRAGKKVQLFDVRSPDEWKGGHIPGAYHLFLPGIREKAAEFDKSKPTAVYCASGYRASLASSMLKQEGFTDVRNIPGSWQAWKKAGFPMAGKGKKVEDASWV